MQLLCLTPFLYSAMGVLGMELDQLLQRIDELSQWIIHIDGTVKFHINVWYILFGILIATLTAVFWVLSRAFIEKRVRDSLPQIVEQLELKMDDSIDAYFEKRMTEVMIPAGAFFRSEGEFLVIPRSSDAHYEITRRDGKTEVRNLSMERLVILNLIKVSTATKQPEK